MKLEDILTENIMVSFRSKSEAVEYMEFLHGILGSEIESPNGFFYPNAKFYDRCIEECGDDAGNEPAVRVERYFDGSYDIGYCNAQYYRNYGRKCVYYQDIRDELFGVDDDINPANDVSMLFS